MSLSYKTKAISIATSEVSSFSLTKPFRLSPSFFATEVPFSFDLFLDLNSDLLKTELFAERRSWHPGRKVPGSGFAMTSISSNALIDDLSCRFLSNWQLLGCCCGCSRVLRHSSLSNTNSHALTNAHTLFHFLILSLFLSTSLSFSPLFTLPFFLSHSLSNPSLSHSHSQT